MRLLTTLVALLVSLNVTAEVFTFTAIPDQDESRLQQRFGKIAHYLEETLGVEVRYIPVKSYAAAISAFRNNQVQLAWFGGLSGAQARARVPGSEAIAQGYEDQFFKTYFIAHRDSHIKTSKSLPETLTGKTFTFGSKGSTSGRLMPEFYLRQRFEKSPREIFSRVGFSGNHSRTLALVESGAYQVGALNYQVWEKALTNNEIDTDKVKVIWQTPTYPDYQWTVRGDVDDTWGSGFKQRVQQALLAIDQEALLQAFPRQAFVPADNSLYQPIIDTAIAIGLMDE